TFGTGIGAGRSGAGRTEAASADPAPAAAVTAQGEVLVAVARTDAPLGEVMRTIERALQDRRA
ncbi:TetR family transcriptional regulator, partial [Streptomyces lunaelactis]|nr:TetR family transcriptional regulator [Streptomyces lunaelactis]